MKAKMTHAARRELVDAIRSRYRAASGYHEKSAIRVLNQVPIAKQSRARRQQFIA